MIKTNMIYSRLVSRVKQSAEVKRSDWPTEVPCECPGHQLGPAWYRASAHFVLGNTAGRKQISWRRVGLIVTFLFLFCQ